MMAFLDGLHLFTSGMAATMAAICVVKHLEIGLYGKNAGVHLFSHEAAASSAALLFGMVLTAFISWAVEDCQRTAPALVLANMREAAFAYGMGRWAHYLKSLGNNV